MHAHSIGQTQGGRCGRGDPYDLGGLWRAMTGRGGGRHRYRGFGPPGGMGGYGFGGGPRGRWRKARRGDIRTAALLLLAEEPRNGYQIMQEVEERSEGVWRPSPGSVYPALSQLEDEGLIRSEETDGRKLFRLTPEGEAYVKERGEDERAPWELMSEERGDQVGALARLGREVAFAFAQVMRTGSESQLAEARKVLADARRSLYRILGEGGEGESADEPR